jgi:DUF1365 family protein
VNSALYEGKVRHRRRDGLEHEFHYGMFMAYLDLAELPQLFDRRLFWSARRPALAWFRRSDHLGDPAVPLEESVRALVTERTGKRPEGPIRLLTHLRYFGHCFNPVSFYYCFDADGEHVSAVVAHVTNTPWGESHSYVLDVEQLADHGAVKVISGSFSKRLHVSPLMGMEHTYQWRLSEPSGHISVHIESGDGSGEPVFDATLSLARREMSSAQMARALARYPFLTMRIMARIYTHALRLRLKGARYFPHPSPAEPAAEKGVQPT